MLFRALFDVRHNTNLIHSTFLAHNDRSCYRIPLLGGFGVMHVTFAYAAR
jgi:hypothetical protein